MRDDLRWDRLALLAGLLVCNQYAAGALNDAVDAEADAAADRGKPIQRGVISRRAVATAAVVAGVASLGFGLALGPATFLLAVVGLACAWSYDLWLKGTIFSALPFAIAVPVVPLFGYGAAGRFPAVLWWAWPIGALLAVATHLADALPDVERDRATGVKGLATRLGVGRAAAVAAACYGAAWHGPVSGWPPGTPVVVAGPPGRVLGRPRCRRRPRPRRPRVATGCSLPAWPPWPRLGRRGPPLTPRPEPDHVVRGAS